MVRAGWWGDFLFDRNDVKLSILDVIEFGTIDFKLAGLLWLLMEQRASLLVASGPSFVGKTTLLHTMLDFLPPQIKRVTLRGYEEDFKSLGNDKPENTYLVTEEISNHSYEYLWGYQVVKAFELLSKGYALGGTIHARNIREVAYLLNALGVSAPRIAGLGVVVTLQAARGRSHYDEPIRYVDTVSTFSLTKDSLMAQILAVRHLPDEKFSFTPEKDLHSILSNKFDIKYESISTEIEARGEFLSRLKAKELSTREKVRNAVLEYYQAKSA